jgi:hypothetical protein
MKWYMSDKMLGGRSEAGGHCLGCHVEARTRVRLLKQTHSPDLGAHEARQIQQAEGISCPLIQLFLSNGDNGGRNDSVRQVL